MSAPPGRVRLAELIAMVSLGTDLGLGQPMEHGLRQTLIAVRLAERLGLGEQARSAVYYVSLVAWVGCHVDAYEQAKWYGDDLALKADIHPLELARLPAKVQVMRRVGAGLPLLERGRLGLRFVAGGLRPRE